MTGIGVRKGKSFFPGKPTPDQCKDTGMALVLICLLIDHFGKLHNAAFIAMVLLIVNMTFPGLYRPVARVWLGLSLIIGSFTSKLLLGFIFLVVVTPVGWLRRMTGCDTLQLKKWKADESSVFKKRDHTFRPEDMERPY